MVRPTGSSKDVVGFKKFKDGTKYFAFCENCEQTLGNVSELRLNNHRTQCLRRVNGTGTSSTTSTSETNSMTTSTTSARSTSSTEIQTKRIRSNVTKPRSNDTGARTPRICMARTAKSNARIQQKNDLDSEDVDDPESIDSTNNDTEKDPDYVPEPELCIIEPNVQLIANTQSETEYEHELMVLSDAPEDVVGEFLFDMSSGEELSRSLTPASTMSELSVVSSFHSSSSNTNIPQGIQPTVMNAPKNQHLTPFSIFKHPSTSTSGSTGSSGESTSPVNRILGQASKTKAVKRTRSHGRTQRERNGTVLNSYIDKVSEEEKIKIIKSMGKFFFGCSIAFNVVESKYFKQMIKELRPSFVPFIPGRKKLSTSVLDQCYEESISSLKAVYGEESVLLIDGWKNKSTNARTVVTMIHTANGRKAFLNAWDITSSSETGELLSQLVDECLKLAKERYNTTIYATVSDNASNMRRMGSLISTWFSTCKSHTGNLLAKDVLDESVKKDAMAVIKEFKQADFEAEIVRLGGNRMITPCDTRWCSYRDAYQRLKHNLSFMKNIMCNESFPKKVKSNIQQLVLNENFIQSIDDQISLLNPVCEVINRCQKENCSIAEGAHLWLKLSFPSKFENSEISAALLNRKKMALDIFSLTAYYLHPEYYNEATSNLDNDQLGKIQEFIIESLLEDGITSFSQYQSNEGIFGALFAKRVKDARAFWNLCSGKHAALSKFALRLIKIPASSAQLERLFSQWQQIHCPVRNRMKFERSKKLAHVYHTLRCEDDIISDSDTEY